MREILFRGKRIDNREWIEGYYAAEPYTKSTYNYGYILENEKDFYAKKAYLVDSRTVGQFTGLTDKNGRKIFEGDIVVINTSEKRKIKKYRVEFDNGIFGIRLSTNANDNTIIPLRAFDYIEIIKGEEND
jgi:uncharacterized phage protein (TIGR01671 family)